MPNQAGPLPFFFCVGNHEIISWGRPEDYEWEVPKKASITGRPHYSFDFASVHFLVIPQLWNANYLSQETLSWLDLDLSVHEGQMTVVLTHNAIPGTTGMGSTPSWRAYHEVVNTDEVLDLLDSHDIVARMHGHNHTFDVVDQDDRLYVSNGRIGGFWAPESDLPERDALGGFYFEVGPDHFEVRGYNATEQRWFDEREGQEHLHQRLDRETSLAPGEPPAISYGVGRTAPGRRVPVPRHHTAGRDGRRLYVRSETDGVLDENVDFRHFDVNVGGGSAHKILDGFSVDPTDDTLHDDDTYDWTYWRWLDPGIELLPRGSIEGATDLYCPPPNRAERGYFDAAPGRTYRIEVDLTAAGGGQQVQFRATAFDRHLEKQFEDEGEFQTLAEGDQQIDWAVTLPERIADDTIYEDLTGNNVIRLGTCARFCHLTAPVTIREFRIVPQDVDDDIVVALESAATDDDPDETVRPDEFEPGQDGTALPESAAAREVVEASESSDLLTWLVRDEAPRWQVRNAVAAEDEAGRLEIGPVRHELSPEDEVSVAPLSHSPSAPQLVGTRRVNRATVETEQTGRLRVSVADTTGGSDGVLILERVSDDATVSGGSVIEQTDEKTLVRVADDVVTVVNER